MVRIRGREDFSRGLTGGSRVDANYSHFTRPGKHTKNYGKIHHAINGKTHYFYGNFQ